MKRLLIFTLLFIFLLGCAKENENPLTSDDPDIPINLVLAATALPLPDANWELIATLERNPLRTSDFYVPDGKVKYPPDLTDVLNGAYAEGKHFIFVIHRQYSIEHVQFYLFQPAPPVYDEPEAGPGHIHYHIFKWHFPSDESWNSWYQSKTVRDTTYAGLSVEFDLTPDQNIPPRRKYWQPPKFFVSSGSFGSGFHILDGITLRIYVNR